MQTAVNDIASDFSTCLDIPIYLVHCFTLDNSSHVRKLPNSRPPPVLLPTVVPPRRAPGIPMLGFGVVDCIVMTQVGSALEGSLGAAFGMCAREARAASCVLVCTGFVQNTDSSAS